MKTLLIATGVLFAAAAQAAPVHYTLDPRHTTPNFEVPHIQNISMFRARFDKTTGSVTLDREAKTGALDVTIDATSVDFAVPELSKHVMTPDMLDVAKYPTITYKSTKIKFDGNGNPSEIDGDLTLHGVTKPVTLTITSFKCITNPTTKKEVCGADATGTFNRSDFGIDFGGANFDKTVKLGIQVEASPDSGAPPAAG
jgi:polyisoprenoid-binding protein YceI